MTLARTRCGMLRASDTGKEVTIFGWVDRRRDHGGLIFLDMRDSSGILQAVINPQTNPKVHQALQDVRLEWVLQLSGEVSKREPANVNPKRETGEVELQVNECEVLAIAKTPPFAVNEDSEVAEALRLEYRYLDL